MNSDLISRSELKKAITEATYNFEQIPIRVDKVQEIIDNAPTVKIDTNDIEYKAYCKGLEDGKKIARPQGKWIYHTDGYIAFYTCNRCNGFGDIDDKFCSHCGATMEAK